MPISNLDQRCARLRQKLKEWEASFAAAHGGRKPSREDVKRNPDIAQRYKDYNKIRSKSLKPESSPSQSPFQRKRPLSPLQAHETLAQTPSKRLKPLPSSHPSVVDPYDPPISLLLSPSQQRPCIGPTPQKDGQVLGMFDGLSSSSKSKTPLKRQALEILTPNVQATPSKKLTSQKSTHKDATKLDIKVTPSIRRITKSCTPGSRSTVRKLRFDDTPAFLRRDNQQDLIAINSGVTNQEAISWSPVAVRKFSNYSGRSLSAIVRGLRDLEDEQLDEELELMREMEGDGCSAAISRPVSKPQILVEDIQASNMPLGPDRGPDSENEEADYVGEGKDRNGKPLKIRKKKGQKRTTRLISMRPNTSKWKPEQKWKGDDSDGEGEPHKKRTELGNDPKSDSREGASINSIPDDSNDSEDAVEGKQSRKTKCERKSQDGKGSPPKKAKKKISATAHANFRALKIKNKNSKAKRGRRFGKNR